ncbi:MAG: 1,4-dihydroxy-2-naphthoate polyprenyltransferase [Candidatus Nanopelagicales bacterium]
MASPGAWIGGARPRTLPAALAPVAVGSGVAAHVDSFRVVPALLALLVAVAFQVGVNYHNDYSDGVKGTDARRVGPVRLVGQGLASPESVKRAAIVAFALGAVAGLALTVVSAQWWLVPAGIASVLAGWFYTGGPRPYGYAGLGEVFVFVFFGLVAVVGTAASQIGTVIALAVVAAVPVGLWACAILIANNLRDIPTDVEAGKHTLAVRLGDRRTRILFIAVVLAGFAVVVGMVVVTPWVLLALAGLVPAARPLRTVGSGATGAALVPALAGTGITLLIGGVGLAIGLALG